MQQPSDAERHQEGANETTALRFSSAAVDKEICCSSGRNTEEVLLKSARQQSINEIQEGTEARRASSSANVRLGEGRRLQMGQLSDHDWGVLDWAGGNCISIWGGIASPYRF